MIKQRFLTVVSLAALSMCLGLALAMDANAVPRPCGDFNNDGKRNVGDATYGLDYLLRNGPPPASFDTADMDFAFLYTINDAAVVFSCIFSDCFYYDCPSVTIPLSAPLDESVSLRYDDHIPAGKTSYGIQIGLSQTLNSITSAQIPLKLTIDGAPAAVDSIVLEHEVGYGGIFFSEVRDSGIIVLLGMRIVTSENTKSIARVWVSVPESASDLPVSAEWITLTPHQAPIEQAGSLYPFFVTHNYDLGFDGRFTPTLDASCCLVAGDANDDGRVTIADVTYGLARIFSGGPPSNCPRAADANADGSYNIGDQTHLVNYIFMGGPAPSCGP